MLYGSPVNCANLPMARNFVSPYQKPMVRRLEMLQYCRHSYWAAKLDKEVQMMLTAPVVGFVFVAGCWT